MRVTFYEKPGCITNGRQKALLREAGHVLAVRDLLSEPWTPGRLRSFFGEMPVSQWFNRAAPRVKNGEVDPAACEAQTALALLLADPLLIRRPLIEAGDWRCAGFEAEEVDRAIGLGLQSVRLPDARLEGCANDKGPVIRNCPVPVRVY